ncbi:MAG: hypothetical protein GWN73_04315, partial [Actinobacteria bacterium]|nr:hypothetical protein [Actinomycetota bacterium]NIS29314.1 hypothetical protein [Actinomycetota bacterium]NIU64696.1 hypothetical protein [Actinomycetota bacterium]NIW26490.1 hypothetical protein [Actinomycetota bacterium]
VRLRTATETRWSEFSARVGNRMRTDVFDIDVIGWSGGSHGRVAMRVRGPIERIVAATALDAERRRVDTGTDLRHNEEDATLTIRVRRWPRFIRLHYA